MLGRRLVFLTATLLTAAVLVPAAVAALAPVASAAPSRPPTIRSGATGWPCRPASASAWTSSTCTPAPTRRPWRASPTCAR